VRSADGSFGAASVEAFTAHLASSDPVPGGGSAAAVAGSLGAALTVMVARLSQDRPRYAAYEPTHRRAIEAGEAARLRFLHLADLDAQAYASFAAAMKLPRLSDAQRATRQAAMADAARASTLAPLETVRLCESTMRLVEALAGRSNANASSDLRVAARLLDAACEGAADNVRTNLPSVGDADLAAEAAAEVARSVAVARSLAGAVHRLVANGTVRPPEGG
jgi:formiminotetrahydrofolate cyclodeaminase